MIEDRSLQKRSMTNFNVVPPQNNYRGLSYGIWLALWNNWLLSEDPDKYDGGPMLYLRGNLDYRTPVRNISYPRSINHKGINDRTGREAVAIFEHTAIFIPVITSCYTLGTLVDGRLLKTEKDVRQHVNTDIEQGGDMWATIQKKDDSKPARIVKDLKQYVVETSLFRLVIPKESILNKKQYLPEEKPGNYLAVSCAYCIIIEGLQAARYVITFGGKGRGDYYSNSVYELTVSRKSSDTVTDISARKRKEICRPKAR
jgi:hypothetical protein